MIELAIVFALCIAIIIFSIVRKNKRKANLKKAADSYGWDYAPNDEYEVGRNLMNNFKLGTKGSNQKPRHLLSGKVNDAKFIILDYQFRYSETFIARGTYTKNQIDDQTILILENKNWQLPQFSLIPKMRSGRKRPDEGIVFENELEFSSNYILDGTDSEAISGLFEATVRQYFADNRECYLEGHNQQLLICREDELQSPNELHLLLEKGEEIKNLLIS